MQQQNQQNESFGHLTVGKSGLFGQLCVECSHMNSSVMPSKLHEIRVISETDIKADEVRASPSFRISLRGCSVVVGIFQCLPNRVFCKDWARACFIHVAVTLVSLWCSLS